VVEKLRLLCFVLGALGVPTACAQVVNVKHAPENRVTADIKTGDRPLNNVTLRSPMTGRVKAIRISPGQSVGVGTVLLEFDCDELVRTLHQAEMDWRAAEQLATAFTQWQDPAGQTGIDAALALTRAQVERLRVERHHAQRAQCTLRAPAGGRVMQVNTVPGGFVLAEQPLLELASVRRK